MIIVTWCRPGFVRRCLESLVALAPGPNEIIVVDASSDDATKMIVADFPRVTYVSFPGGAGHMTTSRNQGLLHASGDVIAFLDDDTVVHQSWLKGIKLAFADRSVGAVAGRTCNCQPGEGVEGVHSIGRLLPDGELTANFAADPGQLVFVDHGIGANMAFRRAVLAEAGGFRDDFGGVGGVREDTDAFLRIKRMGHSVLFSAAAAVDHLGAPQVRGRRFDFRYQFWARRNHGLLLARNFGLTSRIYWQWLAKELVRVVAHSTGNPARRVVRIALGFVGIAAAVEVSVRKASIGPTPPVRRDDIGCAVAAHLSPDR